MPDFDERQGLSGQQLLALWRWSEADFLHHTEGSPIRRMGHERWQRNIAVALGNALAAAHPDSQAMRAALEQAQTHASPLVREHVQWALSQPPATAGNARGF